VTLRADVSVLYVDPRGPYPKLVADWWDEKRDARLYAGPNPVVAHPPCERWGRYWSGGPSAKAKCSLGDDNGCFAAALASVCRFGGVLEHPEGSHAFRRFDLRLPEWRAGWLYSGGASVGHAWVCCVAQGNYGHRARKLTWLFCAQVGAAPPPELDWSIPAPRSRLDYGFHSAAERAAKRSEVAPRVNATRLTTQENLATPLPFAELLLGIAAQARTVARSA
jgi:hypothetical protein